MDGRGQGLGIYTSPFRWHHRWNKSPTVVEVKVVKASHLPREVGVDGAALTSGSPPLPQRICFFFGRKYIVKPASHILFFLGRAFLEIREDVFFFFWGGHNGWCFKAVL